MPDIDVNELKTAKGIPGFWLRALKNSEEIKHHIFEADEPILKSLTGLREEMLDGNVLPLSEPHRVTKYSLTLLRTSTSPTQNLPRQ